MGLPTLMAGPRGGAGWSNAAQGSQWSHESCCCRTVRRKDPIKRCRQLLARSPSSLLRCVQKEIADQDASTSTGQQVPMLSSAATRGFRPPPDLSPKLEELLLLLSTSQTLSIAFRCTSKCNVPRGKEVRFDEEVDWGTAAVT